MAENERKTWVMYKKAPVNLQYTEGALADWRGTDSPINNDWIDRIKGYKLSPTIPEHFSHIKKENCYYNDSFESYMTSNFAPPDGDYTFEFVLKDAQNIVGNQYDPTLDGGVWSEGAGFLVTFSQKEGIAICRAAIDIYNTGKRTQCFSVLYRDRYNRVHGCGKDLIQSKMKPLSTISYSTQNIFLDGNDAHAWWTNHNNQVRISTDTLVIGSHSNDTNKAVKNMKVCAVRWYPFVLTAEQREQNYQADIQRYNLEGVEY